MFVDAINFFYMTRVQPQGLLMEWDSFKISILLFSDQQLINVLYFLKGFGYFREVYFTPSWEKIYFRFTALLAYSLTRLLPFRIMNVMADVN